jgi:AraC-like DNA-binding protein
VGQPLSTVAAALGYEGASAFSAMFKRALGRSPREFFGGE